MVYDPAMSTTVISGVFAVIAAIVGALLTAWLSRGKPPMQKQAKSAPAQAFAPAQPGWPGSGQQSWPAAGQAGTLAPALAPAKVTRAMWWAVANLICWLVPLFGFPVGCIALGIALRDRKPGSVARYANAALGLAIFTLLLTLISFAYGWQHPIHFGSS